MIRQTFSQREILEQFADKNCLGEIFQEIEQRLKTAGQVVCQFTVNGMTLDESDEKRLSASFVDEIETLEVSSQLPEVLMTEVLKNWVTQIPAMIVKSDEIAKTLRFEGLEGHVTPFVELIDSCQLLVDSLISLDNLFRENKFVQAENWQKNEDMTARAIGEALNCFQKKDFVLLADILEYDLGHSLQNWTELLKQFHEQLSGDPDATTCGPVD